MSTLHGQPGVWHLFRKHIENDAMNQTCLTCKDKQKYREDTSHGGLQQCDYSEVIISPDFDSYVQVLIS